MSESLKDRLLGKWGGGGGVTQARPTDQDQAARAPDSGSVGALSPAPYNPRKITDEQLKALRAALEEFGDLGGIIFNKRTGRLVGGHQRVKVLDATWTVRKAALAEPDPTGTVARGSIQTPWGELAYREVDWPEQKEMAANIAANAHGGAWEDRALRELIVQIDDGAFDLRLLGFDAKELEEIINFGEEAPGEGERAEVKFSEELDEASNYVVLKVDTNTDWLQVLSVLGLGSVYSRRRDGSPWSKGVGRVMKWSDAVAKIKASL